MIKRHGIILIFLLLHLSGKALFAQTTLLPGDLVVVGLASNVGGDVGDCTLDGSAQFSGRDRVSFFCFKDISPGTVIDITDNGWERENAGLWGNTEGFIRATRTGSPIPAGTVITFEFPPVTTTAAKAIAPDGAWDFSQLGTNALNFNDSGDQIYFLQGGQWENGTVIGCCNGEQDASYSGGRILFGFNSRNVWNGFQQDSQNSALHPQINSCFSMAPATGISSFTRYSGPLSTATQLEWVGRIGDPGNWSVYEDCASYQDPPDSFPIGTSGMYLECLLCQSCGPFQDTLMFMLPPSGAPFSVSYSDGRDTFQLTGVSPGEEVAVWVDSTTTYRLISVSDVDSCPVYSNFGQPAELIVLEGSLEISLENKMTVTDCTTDWGITVYEIKGGTPPYFFRADPMSAPEPINDLPFSITGLPAGYYNLVFEDQAGCESRISTLIPAGGMDNNNLFLDLGFDVDIVRGQGVRIEPLVNFSPVSVNWYPETGIEDPATIFTVIRPKNSTSYTVTLTDERGCTVTDSILIRVTNEEKVFIPSAFSPNEDGINDRFALFPGPEVQEILSFRIFDRWGTLVFNSADGLIDHTTGWDGKLPNRQPAGAGIYLYAVEMLDTQGNHQSIKGSVTLLR